MPKQTKRDQLLEVQKLLAKAAYQLSAEGDNYEGGYLALQNARAIVADLNGDIDAARSARRYAEHMASLSDLKPITYQQLHERRDASPNQR